MPHLPTRSLTDPRRHVGDCSTTGTLYFVHTGRILVGDEGVNTVAEETVEVVVKPDGGVEIHVAGYPGMDCLNATEELIRSLGGQVVEQSLTAEAYQDVEESQHHHTGR